MSNTMTQEAQAEDLIKENQRQILRDHTQEVYRNGELSPSCANPSCDWEAETGSYYQDDFRNGFAQHLQELLDETQEMLFKLRISRAFKDFALEMTGLAWSPEQIPGGQVAAIRVYNRGKQ